MSEKKLKNPDKDVVFAILKGEDMEELHDYARLCLLRITDKYDIFEKEGIDTRIEAGSETGNCVRIKARDMTEVLKGNKQPKVARLILVYMLNRDEWMKDFVSKETHESRFRPPLPKYAQEKFWEGISQLCTKNQHLGIGDETLIDEAIELYNSCIGSYQEVSTADTRKRKKIDPR